MKASADYTLDFRNKIASLTMLQVTKIFREMKSKQILEIIGQDLDTCMYVFQILPKDSYRLLVIEDTENEDDIYRIRLEKKTHN